MGVSGQTNVSTIGVGLLGLGVVGSAVAKALLSRDQSKERKIPLALVSAVVRDPNKLRSIDLGQSIVTDDPQAVIDNNSVSIVVELMGGENPAFDYISSSLKAGKHVVTANKEVMCKRGNELLRIAAENNVELKYEASVGGGIPIIGPLTNDLVANRIQSIRAIINGTTNFILTKMAYEGADFDDVLAEAQSLGYAEADPSTDIDGVDAAHKLALLSSLAFGTAVDFQSISVEGIRFISSVDIEYAVELGYAIKLLAVAQKTQHGIEQRVQPSMVSKDTPLAHVNGVTNAVVVQTNICGDTMYPVYYKHLTLPPKA